jgi:hypothetical protein
MLQPSTATPMATKRPRNVADIDEHALPSSNHPPNFQLLSDPESTAKLARVNVPPSSQRPLLCSLPPTCNPPHNTPTRLENSAELEKHYAMYHAHVCEERGCGAVFPEERLLGLVSHSRRLRVHKLRSQSIKQSVMIPLQLYEKKEGIKLCDSFSFLDANVSF